MNKSNNFSCYSCCDSKFPPTTSKLPASTGLSGIPRTGYITYFSWIRRVFEIEEYGTISAQKLSEVMKTKCRFAYSIQRFGFSHEFPIPVRVIDTKFECGSIYCERETPLMMSRHPIFGLNPDSKQGF